MNQEPVSSDDIKHENATNEREQDANEALAQTVGVFTIRVIPPRRSARLQAINLSRLSSISRFQLLPASDIRSAFGRAGENRAGLKIRGRVFSRRQLCFGGRQLVN